MYPEKEAMGTVDIPRRPRRMVPIQAFGINSKLSHAVMPMNLEEMSYVSCIESRLALVSHSGSSASRPRHSFFLDPGSSEHLLESVTALGVHHEAKLLAACGTRRKKRIILVYTLQHEGKLPSILQSLLANTHVKFLYAVFSHDSKTLVTATQNTVFGWDWRKSSLLFSSDTKDTSTLVYHPRDALEIATSGPQAHLQLWRYVHKQLKPRPKIIDFCLKPEKDSVTTHAWLWLDDTDVLVAGTLSGDVLVIQRNELNCKFMQAHPISSSQDHSVGIRAVSALETGFVSMCAQGVACVFIRSGDQTQKFHLARRFQLNQVATLGSIKSALSFANSTHVLVTCNKGLAYLDLATLLLVTDGIDLQPSNTLQALDGPYHDSAVSCVAAAKAKPVLASCSISTRTTSLFVWDWRINKCVSRFISDDFIQNKKLTCLDMHPLGNSLIAGFEHEVLIYHATYRELTIAQTLSTHGIVKLSNDSSPLLATHSLSILRYSRSGHYFAAVTGRFVQLFASITNTGKAALVQCLVGHANTIIDLVWSVDDMRLWTAADDGAIYEWAVGKFDDFGRIISRTREFVGIDLTWKSLTIFADGGLVAAGIHTTSSQSTHDEATTNSQIAPSVLNIWSHGMIDGAVVTVRPDTTITTIYGIDEADGFEALLIIGTSRGSLLMYTWPQNGQTPQLKHEVSICDGPVQSLSYSCEDHRLCIAGGGGSVVVCTLAGTISLFGEANGNTSIHTETILLESGQLTTLKNKLRSLSQQLEQAICENKKQAREAAPDIEGEALRIQEYYREELKMKDVALLERDQQVVDVHAMQEAQLARIKSKFDNELLELETLYDKKLAIEAARYTELEEERDRQLAQAENELLKHQEASEECQTQLRNRAKEELAEKEKEVQLLKEYVQHAKQQFHAVIDDQDERHGETVFEIRKETETSLEAAEKERQFLRLENAKLKRKAMDLEDEYHKNRDELISCQQALSQEKGKTRAQSEEVSKLREDLLIQTARVEELEQKTKEEEEKLKELETLRKVLEQDKTDINTKVTEKDARLMHNEKRIKQLDAVLEDAGKKALKSNEHLQCKNAQLKRVSIMLDESRRHIRTKDKSLEKLEEELSVFLIQLRDPQIRPKETVVSQITIIKNKIQKLIASTPKDVHTASDYFALANTKIRYVKKFKKDPNSEYERKVALGMAQKLRTHNHKLIDEVNDLRLDRISLRQRLKKIEVQSPVEPLLDPTEAVLSDQDSASYHTIATQQKLDALFQPVSGIRPVRAARTSPRSSGR